MADVVLNDDSWKAAYLLTCHVSDCGCATPSQQPIPGNAALEINYYDSLGRFVRSSTRASIIDEADTTTRARVEEYLHEAEPFFGFLIHRAWVKLAPAFASELHADLMASHGGRRSHAYNLKINEIMKTLCAISAKDRLVEGERVVQNILYFEPKLDLVPQAPQEMDLASAAGAICEYFGADGRSATPAVLEDMVLLPESGFGKPSYSCVAVRLRPFEELEGLQLPSVLIQLLNQAAACRIKKWLTRDLHALPISGESYWDMFRTMKSFRSYNRDYITQRTDTEKLIQRSSEAMRAMEDRLPIWLLAGRWQEFEAVPEVRSKHGWWSWRTVRNLLQTRMIDADVLLNEGLRRVIERTRVLDEFLRDAALADVSDANLKLARSVRYLSWIVLLVSVIGLAISALPDSRKDAYFAMLFGGSERASPK